MKPEFGNPQHIAIARLEGHAFMIAAHGKREPAADCGCCLLWRQVGRIHGLCARYREDTGREARINARAEACGVYR
jgi:hypothetical protein